MAKKISSLSVVLGATVAPFVNAFKGAGSSVTGLVGKLAGAGKSVLKFTGLAGGIAGVLGGAGLGMLIKTQLDAIDVNAKLVDRLGVTSEALGGLQHAGDLAGVSSEQLTGGLEFMLKNIAKATKGGELAKAFEGIGLDPKALANAKTEDALSLIADALKAIENPAQRALAATQIFGKSGQQLLPLLLSGAEGIAAAQKEAEALGLTFSRIDAAKVEEANDAMTRVKSAVTGVFRSITIAIAPALSGAATTLTGIGVRIVAAVKGWLPPAIATLQNLWAITGNVFNAIYTTVAPIVSALGGYITTAWQAVLAFVTPIVVAIRDHIARNWQAGLAATIGFLGGIWNVVSSVFGVVWSIVKTVGSGVAAVWTSAMDMLGFETLSTGATVGGVFQTLADAGLWLMEKITFALNVIAFSITHWRDVFELAAAEVALFVVKTGNEFVYVFTDVIPGVLTWFADNWRDIFTTMASFTAATFTNMGKNVVGFFTAIWSFLKGDGFNFEWTSLTEGFENTIKQLPQIAERHIGPIEQALQDQANSLRGGFAEGLAAHLAEQDKAIKGTTDAIVSAVDAAGDMLTPPTVDAPIIPPATMAVDADTSAIEGIGEKAKQVSTQLKAVFSGTAEAQRARFEAAFAARLQPGTSSATPAAAPVPSGASKAMRESADQSKALQQLVVLATAGNKTLVEIRDDAAAGETFEEAEL